MFSMGWAEAPVFAGTDIPTIRFHFEPDVATIILNYVYTDEFMSASYRLHPLTYTTFRLPVRPNDGQKTTPYQ